MYSALYLRVHAIMYLKYVRACARCACVRVIPGKRGGLSRACANMYLIICAHSDTV